MLNRSKKWQYAKSYQEAREIAKEAYERGEGVKPKYDTVR